MSDEDKNINTAETGIRIREYYHGAWSGEFPTIIVVTLSFVAGGIATGVLSSIGEDIWRKLKGYLKGRFNKYEQHRKSQQGTRNPRNRVLSIYIVGQMNALPIIYYVAPSGGELDLEFNFNELAEIESEIRTRIDTAKLVGGILGINLGKLDSGRYLSIFREIPSQHWFDGPDAFKPPEEHTVEEINALFAKKDTTNK